ncbi:DUF4942 domain-containing protein [Sphingobacterium thalpophilum]|uniref:DUF4942 domain-containing protein n=1 Tax=Sphingobacterium thalpophilum TaxID=259 RepID=UPI0024A79E74|nr:DUF4942 domain-containing protein [Sphingobacterium thalpophilum]
MFNKDFYPTPRHVISQMLAPYELLGKTMLEPSSGKGDIIDYAKSRGANVLCCEINPDLATISSSKAKLIAKDFLTVTSDKISHVNVIAMNPPFSADEQHILHAWNIAPDGCEIVALCNWQTLANPFSKTRKELSAIISNYGYSENIGDLFSDAERVTGIDIGLIRLTKPATADSGFEDYFTDEQDDPEKHENGLMSYNAVREVVQRYVNAVKLYDQVLETAVKMNELTSHLAHVKDVVFTCTQDKVQVSRDDFAKELQKKSWGWIIGKMNLQKYSTRGLMDDINKFVEQQKNAKFTMKNIYLMLDAIVQTAGQRMDKALLEVFDNLTMHYHENRWNVEGWKTNSHYLVNKKFIEPYIAPLSRWGSMDINSNRADRLDDLDKALCYITGQPWSNERRFYPCVDRGNYGEWFDWGFFEVKLFKKGTGHFKFKDENVWALFNQQIARIKGFPLPESVRRSA